MKQKKALAYRESQEGKVSHLLRRLDSYIKLAGKIEKIQQKIEKLKQSLTTNPQQAQNIRDTIAQYEAAVGNYEEEMKIHNLTIEETNNSLDRIKMIIAQIEALPAYPENQKQIHKNLKNLNRFEEHLLIFKTRSQNEQFIVNVSQIISQVVEKKHQIINMIDKTNDDQVCPPNQCQQIKGTDEIFPETPTSLPDEQWQHEKQELKHVKQSNSQNTIQFVKEIEKSNKDLDGFNTPTADGQEDDQIFESQKNQQPQESENQLDDQNNNNSTDFQAEQEVAKSDQIEQICEMEKCQICFAKRRKYVAIPCGHFIYCQNCKDIVLQKMRCLLCRQAVCKMFEVFL